MTITIIIPTINRYSDLNNTISFLQKQSFQDFEIIVVDQTSSEKLEKLNDGDKRTLHLHHPEFASASKARNLGILKAKGKYLLFLDDDVIIENSHFLQAHLNAYQEKDCEAVYGSVLELRVNQKPREEKSFLSNYNHWGWLFFPQNYNKGAYVESARSCNFSVKRDIAIQIGGMDENYEKGAHREEGDFCFRLIANGGKIWFSPEARLVHIGNAVGGIRSWDTVKRTVKAQHHFDGASYYLFKNVKWVHYPPHFLSLFMFFFYDKKILSSFANLKESTIRMFKSWKNARIKIKLGPKYLEV